MLIWGAALTVIFVSFDFTARRPAARLAALTTYAAADAESSPKICDFR
jgi:hypothetical protein